MDLGLGDVVKLGLALEELLLLHGRLLGGRLGVRLGVRLGGGVGAVLVSVLIHFGGLWMESVNA